MIFTLSVFDIVNTVVGIVVVYTIVRMKKLS